MSDVPFYATRMGRTYYEHQLPELVRQVTRLADALERLAMNFDSTNPASKDATTKKDDDDGQDSNRPQGHERP